MTSAAGRITDGQDAEGHDFQKHQFGTSRWQPQAVSSGGSRHNEPQRQSSAGQAEPARCELRSTYRPTEKMFVILHRSKRPASI